MDPEKSGPAARGVPKKSETRKRASILFVKPEDVEDLQDFSDRHIEYEENFHDLSRTRVNDDQTNGGASPPDGRKSVGKKKRGRKKKRKLPKEHPCCDDDYSEDDMGLEAELDDDEYIRRLEEAQEEEELAVGKHRKDRFEDEDDDDFGDDMYAYSPNQQDMTNEYVLDGFEEKSCISGMDEEEDREVQITTIDWEKALQEELAEVMDDSEKPELILPTSSTDLRFPNDYLLAALGIYEVCRRYRKLLRLSPFRLEDFLASLVSYENCSILSEVHMSLLKVLVREDDANNTLLCHTDQKDCVNFSFFLLDHQTWPELLRQYLACTGFEHTVALEVDSCYPFVHFEKRLAVLLCLVDMFLTTSSLRGEIVKETLSRHEDFCRICHSSGEVLCCDECTGVYHLQCLEPPLTEAPDIKWSCPVCLKEATVGVTDCVADEERSGCMHQHDLLGKDRFGRKYWFVARRLIVESREVEPDGILRQENLQLHSTQTVLYYSIWPKVEQLLELLDPAWESDLIDRIKSISIEMERQMELTVELTVNRWMLLQKVLKQSSSVTAAVKEPAILIEYVETKNMYQSSSKPIEQKVADASRLFMERYKEKSWISSTGDFPMCLLDGSMLGEEEEEENETQIAEKKMCFDLTGMNQPPRPESPTGIFEEYTSTEDERKVEILIRNRDGTRMRLKISKSTCDSLSEIKNQQHAFSDNAEYASIFTNPFFRLSDEGSWRKWLNLYTTDPMSLSKQQHIEERDRRRLLQNKFSLAPPLSVPIELRDPDFKAVNEASWNWICGGPFPALMQGKPEHIMNMLRLTVGYIESQIPLALYCPAWVEKRKMWHSELIKASSPMQLAYLLALLEACIKPVCYHRAWYYSIGYLQLDRTLAAERDEQKRITALERKIKMSSELMDNSIIRTRNPRAIRHTVWKTRGEEYRRLGGDGWVWISVSYGCEKQRTSNLSRQSVPLKEVHTGVEDDFENISKDINPLTKKPYRRCRQETVLRNIDISHSLQNKSNGIYKTFHRPNSSSTSFIDKLLFYREAMQNDLADNLEDAEMKLQELQELQQKMNMRRETLCQMLESINQGNLPTAAELKSDDLEAMLIDDAQNVGRSNDEMPLTNLLQSTKTSVSQEDTENTVPYSSSQLQFQSDSVTVSSTNPDEFIMSQLDGVNDANIRPRAPSFSYIRGSNPAPRQNISSVGHPLLVKISSSSQSVNSNQMAFSPNRPFTFRQAPMQQSRPPSNNFKFVRIVRPSGGGASITVIPHGLVPNGPRSDVMRANRPMSDLSGSSIFSSNDGTPMIQSVCSLAPQNGNSYGRAILPQSANRLRFSNSGVMNRMQIGTTQFPRINTNALFSRGVMASRRATAPRAFRQGGTPLNFGMSYVSGNTLVTRPPLLKPLIRSVTPNNHAFSRKAPLASRDGLVNTPTNALALRAQQSLIRRQNLQAAERNVKERLTSVELKLQKMAKSIAKMEKVLLLSKKTTADSFHLEISKTEISKSTDESEAKAPKHLSCPEADAFCFVNDENKLTYNLFRLSPSNLRQCILKAGRIEMLGWDIERKRSTQVQWPYPSSRPGFCVTWRYRLAQGGDSLSCVALHTRLFWHSLRWDDIKEKIVSAEGYCPLPSGGGLRATDILEDRGVSDEVNSTRRRLIINSRSKDKYGLINEYLVQLQSQGSVVSKSRSSYATLGGDDEEDDADSDPDFNPHSNSRSSGRNRRFNNSFGGVLNGRRSAAAARQSISSNMGITSSQWNVVKEEWMAEIDLQLWEIRSYIERSRAAENRMLALLNTPCVDDLKSFNDGPLLFNSDFNFTVKKSSEIDLPVSSNSSHIMPLKSSYTDNQSRPNRTSVSHFQTHTGKIASNLSNIPQNKALFQKRQRLTMQMEKRAKQLETSFFERKSLLQLKAMIEINAEACIAFKKMEDARELEMKRLAEEAEFKKLHSKKGVEKRKRSKEKKEALSPSGYQDGMRTPPAKRRRKSSQSNTGIINGEETDSGATEPCILENDKMLHLAKTKKHDRMVYNTKDLSEKFESVALPPVAPRKRGRPPKKPPVPGEPIVPSPQKSIPQNVKSASKHHNTNYHQHRKENSDCYCVCKTPYDPTKEYIGCDRCDGWFHFECVGISLNEASNFSQWICPDCRQDTKPENPAHVPPSSAEPAVVRTETEATAEETEIYCLCRTPYDNSKVYIACDGCDEWYHAACVGLEDQDAVNFCGTYLCPTCKTKDSSLMDKTITNAAVSPMLSKSINDTLVSETTRRKLKKILSQLSKQPCAKPFLGSRDSKDPLTFSYVASNLRHGSYSTLGEFIEDICRIFQHFKNTFPANSFEFQSAETLEKKLEDLMKNWIS